MLSVDSLTILVLFCMCGDVWFKLLIVNCMASLPLLHSKISVGISSCRSGIFLLIQSKCEVLSSNILEGNSYNRVLPNRKNC